MSQVDLDKGDFSVSYEFGVEQVARLGQAFVPGLPTLPIGTERYTIRGGGSQSLQIAEGDRIQVIDREGLQPGEVLLFNSSGISQAGFLGSKSGGSPTGLQSIVKSQEKSAKRLDTMLQKLGCDLNSAEVVHIFEEASPSGNTVNFVAECDGLLVVCAPGEQMQAFEQNLSLIHI